jgi:hypothetical protein
MHELMVRWTSDELIDLVALDQIRNEEAERQRAKTPPVRRR